MALVFQEHIPWRNFEIEVDSSATYAATMDILNTSTSESDGIALSLDFHIATWSANTDIDWTVHFAATYDVRHLPLVDTVAVLDRSGVPTTSHVRSVMTLPQL